MDNTDYLISRTYTNYGGSEMEEGYKELLSIEKEKTADEMFKTLGYYKFHENSTDVRYSNSSHEIIAFYGAVKTFEKITYPINMQELQAINKKVLELRVVK